MSATSAFFKSTTGLFLFIVLTVLVGCNSHLLFNKVEQVEGKTWDYPETLEFDFEVSDTTKSYDLILDIYHEASFGYQNLYLKINTIMPQNDPVKDQISIGLTDGFGSWSGSCKGNDCIREYVLQSGFNFRYIGKHTIKISQWSRDSTLHGIKAVGLSVQEAQS